VSAERLPFDELFLKEKLKSEPTTWETRRQLAQGLYDKQAYIEAAEIIWTTDHIPNTDIDLAFAIRVLAKAQPRRSIRLLTAVLELNQGKAVQNMAMANALLHHGMVLQAARFYGAALETDPSLVNPDLEHFMLWSDDESTMWGLFENKRPKLGELPWMVRDPKEALRLTSRVSLHTTPIYVPELPIVPGENLKHELYQQEATHNAKITPPPAVTIPIDRVDPKDRLYDETYGASVVRSAPEPENEEEEEIEAAQDTAPPAPVIPAAPAIPVLSVAPPAPVVPAPPAAPAIPVLRVTPPAPVAPAIPVIPPAVTVTPIVTPEPPAAIVPETAPVTASAPAVPETAPVAASAPVVPETAPVAPITPPPSVSAFPSKVVFPEITAPNSSVPAAIAKETESVAEVTKSDTATSPAPAPAKVVEPFPSTVKFPEITGPSTRVTISARTTPLEAQPPSAPPSAFPSKVVFPDVDEPSAAPVAPAAAAQEDASFFADPNPSALVSAAAITSFFADPTPSESIKLPPIEPEKKVETAPQTVSTDTIKKAPIPEAFPISQSAVPTTILRVKWSTAPARPGGAPATPPVGPPVAPPMPPPSAPPVSAPIPFASPAAQSPAVVPFVQPGSAASAFTASNAPPTAPIAPPAGTPPAPISAAEAGAPTRALLPSGTPPPQAQAPAPAAAPAPATGLRRLLFLPARAVPPAETPSDKENS
jgi:hypothetical protein